MEALSKALVVIVAIEHFYIMVLEMFLWTKPKGLKVFGMKAKQAQDTKVLAFNQGVYNAFLAAGLVWGVCHPNAQFGSQIQIFFLLCVLVAAMVGGFTAKKSILLVQGAPAFVALMSLLLWQ